MCHRTANRVGPTRAAWGWFALVGRMWALLLFFRAGPTPLAAVLPELNTARAVRELPAEEARKGYPARIRGVATWFARDERADVLIVQDATGGVCVRLTERRDRPLEAGRSVEIIGLTAQGDFMPIVVGSEVHQGGQLPMPRPLHPSVDTLFSGSCTAQWVELEGVVHEQNVSPNRPDQLQLVLGVGLRHVRVQIPNTGRLPTRQWVDSRVKVQGVAASILNVRGQLVGVRLLCPSLRFVQILEEGLKDTEIPVIKAGSLFRYGTHRPGHRVRVQGTVLLSTSSGAYLWSDSAVFMLRATESETFSPGQLLEVIGFPVASEGVPTIEHATWRVLGSGKPPEPEQVSVRALLDKRLSYAWVKTTGKVRGRIQTREGVALELEQAGVHFLARVYGHDAWSRFLVDKGAIVNLTGLSLVPQRPQAAHGPLFTLLVPSTEYLQLVAGAPWSEFRVLGYLTVVVGLGGLLTAAWVALLRKRVRQQTETLRQSLERELALEHRYRQLIEASHDGIVTLDAEGRFTSANHAAEELFGWPTSELAGKHFSEVLPANERSRLVALWQRWKVKPEPSRLETAFINRAGKRLVVELTVVPLDQSGAALVLARNVTAQKIHEQQLRAAKEAAEQANRIKTEFLANMSHEIRTPLTAIIGMTELALDTNLTREQREYLETVLTSARGLLRIIDDILDLSRVEAGKLKLNERPFSLPALCDQIYRMVLVRAQQKNLDLSYEIAPEVPHIIAADEDRLRQVLINLLGNAIKYTDEGYVKLEVTVESRPAEASEQLLLHFRVRDSGVGIPPEMQEAIFLPFYQVDGSSSRRHGGAGLGLAIAKRLVELMGGRIWVESQPGRGSTFHFTIRCRPAEVSEVAPSKASISRPSAGPLKILVCEDNPVNQQLIRRLLEREGHHVRVCNNGKEALRALEEECFDLVLMDVQMPEMDGLQATQEIRALEQAIQAGELPAPKGSSYENLCERGRIPIIALTAHAMSGDRERCLAAGMDGYLSKPISAAQLLLEVARLSPKCPTAEPRQPVT